GRPARHRPWSQIASVLSGPVGDRPTDIVFLAGAFADSGTPVADRVKWLTACLQTLGDVAVRLWVVAPGGARGRIGLGASSPGASAIWAYARTATNEYGSVDLRVVDFAQDLDPGQSASQFALMVC